MTAAAPLTRAEIDAAYDNAAHFADVPLWRDRWQQRSAAVRPGPNAQLDLAYGPGPLQKIDLFPTDRIDAPTALFFHGGFWARNGKATFRFLVDALHRAGCHAAFSGYTLAPVDDFGRIAGDARAATRWLAGQRRALGLAERPLLLVGWSAGAHLVALCIADLDVGAGLAISGIYDLEPMRLASINDLLNLDAAAVAAHSPVHAPPPRSAPLTIAYGADELPAFRQQSEALMESWSARGLPVSLLPLPGRHHHSALDDLHEPGARLDRELRRLMAHCA